MDKIAVIGTGKMGSALVRGMLEGGFQSSQIGVIDKVTLMVDKLVGDTNVKPLRKQELSGFSVVLFAVKPQDMKSAIAEYSPHVRKGSLILSIAAGVKLSNLKEWAGRNDVHFARAMPNVGAMVRKSITAMLFEDTVPENLRSLAIKIFKSVGNVYEVEKEELIDAHTCVGGSAPAVVAVFLRALEDSGVLLGIKREHAVNIAVEVVKGVTELLERGMTFEEIKDAVTSPGGTTIEALKYLERKGLRGVVMEAFGKAFEKARKLGG